MTQSDMHIDLLISTNLKSSRSDFVTQNWSDLITTTSDLVEPGNGSNEKKSFHLTSRNT
jgi:hypothetical protein